MYKVLSPQAPTYVISLTAACGWLATKLCYLSPSIGRGGRYLGASWHPSPSLHHTWSSTAITHHIWIWHPPGCTGVNEGVGDVPCRGHFRLGLHGWYRYTVCAHQYVLQLAHSARSQEESSTTKPDCPTAARYENGCAVHLSRANPTPITYATPFDIRLAHGQGLQGPR